LLSLFMYPMLLSVPTVGMLYLTSSAATTWITFRLLPSLLQMLGGQHRPHKSSATLSEDPSHASKLVAGSPHRQLDTLAGSESTEGIKPVAAFSSTASSASGASIESHAALSTTVTTSARQHPFAELQSSTDVEKLLDTSILSHAKKHTRTCQLFREHYSFTKHARLFYTTVSMTQYERDAQC
jgi:hypothetical protein